jgi:hypothetical protein
MTRKFNPGDRVYYKRKRLNGIVLEAFKEGDSPEDGYRYYVKTKQYTWSVPEQGLEMSKSAEIIPINSRVKKPQNDDPGAA